MTTRYITARDVTQSRCTVVEEFRTESAAQESCEHDDDTQVFEYESELHVAVAGARWHYDSETRRAWPGHGWQAPPST